MGKMNATYKERPDDSHSLCVCLYLCLLSMHNVFAFLSLSFFVCVFVFVFLSLCLSFCWSCVFSVVCNSVGKLNAL